MKTPFWASDWFAGMLVVAGIAAFSFSDAFEKVELGAYDLGVRMAERVPGDQVAVLAIDDQSIANIGRWPWPRDVHAAMLDKLAGVGAKVVGYTVLLSEPQQDAGLGRIRDIRDYYQANGLADPLVIAGPLQEPVQQIGVLLDAAAQDLDVDARLADSIASAGNVVLGMQMVMGDPLGNPDAPVPDWLTGSALPEESLEFPDSAEAVLPGSTLSLTPPLEPFARNALVTGHIATPLWADGKVRSEALVLEHQGQLFPSMALQLAARSLNLAPSDIRVRLGEGIDVGRLHIRTDPRLHMRTFFYGGGRGDAFPPDSFYDVYSGRLDPAKYKGKIVLVGATAYGVGSSLTTPLGETLEPVQILAHNVASILNEDFFTVPAWAGIARWLLLLVVAGYLMFGLPKLGAMAGAGASAALLAVITLGELLLLSGSGEWVALMLPAVTLVTGHLALTTRRFLMTERGKRKSDFESAESNRMLGLAFQQAGQLDMAFEKFRRVPLGADMMDPLYNLALDFERKRQFSKAAAVYQYMGGHDKGFRDIEQRMQRASAAQDNMIFGLRGAGGGAGDTLLTGAIGAEKPMLGRYEIERELGRGAMGVVYQGSDPRINRTVAIKTLALAQEFDADELDEVKERFFREAEAAGRLNHPNIVTIYDTGEEHDLAYIAMELLSGHDLVRYTKPDNLLPIQKVLSIVARAAEGLDYAHSQNVVHRDIKPANIMYDPKADTVKIADFGIARLSNSGKTKTGLVVGTPSFMSPEQVTGRKDLDGRTDLFSLGVVLYQLVALQLPWDGEQATQIMYKIATEPFPDPLEIRPDLKKTCPWVSIVLKRALEKDREKRYQTGALMAKDLRACLAKMAEAAKKQAGQAGASPAA
jgi:serine/threonine-protein kinase